MTAEWIDDQVLQPLLQNERDDAHDLEEAQSRKSKIISIE